jgi:hypothetical protein
MSGNLRHTWEYLTDELWTPLADYSAHDAAAPPDLFSDLFAAAEEFLSPRPTDIEMEEARNDPDKACSRFLALKGTDFTSESAIVNFLEKAQTVIADYEISGFDYLYRRLLRDALRKFNLRYRLDEPFILRFLLPGSFTNLYAELHRVNVGNADLASLWFDFESAFDQYARTQTDSDLKTSIAKASNYLEGLASATNGKTGTLSKLCDSLSDWPHDKIKDTVKSLYGFCSDYPGIRHAGTPGNRKRQLDPRDSVAINVTLMALAAYLASGLDHGQILGTGPSGAVRPRKVVSRLVNDVGKAGWFTRLLAKCGINRN